MMNSHLIEQIGRFYFYFGNCEWNINFWFFLFFSFASMRLNYWNDFPLKDEKEKILKETHEIQSWIWLVRQHESEMKLSMLMYGRLQKEGEYFMKESLFYEVDGGAFVFCFFFLHNKENRNAQWIKFEYITGW